MTGREYALLEKLLLKLISTALIAAGLAGMYSLRAHASAPETEQICISQFYGAGASEGVFSNDYVELYNPSDVPVELNDYILTYSSGGEEETAGSTVDSDGVRTQKALSLSGTIPSHGFFLICGSDHIYRDGAYQIRLCNQIWKDLVIDNQATVTLKLFKSKDLADMVSTEGCSCRYMVSEQTAVLCGAAGERRGCGTGIRTFYWGRPISEEFETMYEPQSSYGPADGNLP